MALEQIVKQLNRLVDVAAGWEPDSPSRVIGGARSTVTIGAAGDSEKPKGLLPRPYDIPVLARAGVLSLISVVSIIT